MARKEFDEEYEYEEEVSEPKESKGKTLFMAILGGLLLILTILCVILTGRLRSANKQVELLRSQAKAPQTVSWENEPVVATPAPVTPEETVTVPVETTPSPLEPLTIPTATPAPVVTSADGLPSWLTEANMAAITRRPKDDEWYGSPGKMYVTATLGLNLRSGLRTDINNIITQIRCGSEVEVYAASGNMRFVQDPKGNFGWVSNNLLSSEPPAGVDIIPFAPVATPTPVSTPAPSATVIVTPAETDAVPTPAPADTDVPKPEAPTIIG